jgi:predicted nucleotidyltransferase
MATVAQSTQKWRPVLMREIRGFARRIAERFRPDRIILFGSYAYGQPSFHSDVDLLVIMHTDLDEIAQEIQILQSLDHPFAMDLIVRTPESVRRHSKLGDCFIQEILARGKVLYEAADRKVG